MKSQLGKKGILDLYISTQDNRKDTGKKNQILFLSGIDSVKKGKWQTFLIISAFMQKYQTGAQSSVQACNQQLHHVAAGRIPEIN